jgi:hypothetical protein
MASISLRENVACLRVSRNSCRMSISSTMGMGRSSMRPGNSSSVYLPRSGVVAAFQAGRGRTQHHARAGRLRPHHGHIAPVVARRLFLLVAAVVLFVHHDQAQVAHRREHARARPHHHRGRAGADAPPLLGALHIRERAVQNGHPVAESKKNWPAMAGVRAISGTSSRALRPSPAPLRWREIDFGLSRTGDAVQQESLELPGRMASRICSKAACCAGFSVCRARTGTD